MKQIILTITVFFVLISCSSKREKSENRNTKNTSPTAESPVEHIAIENAEQTLEYSEIENDSNETLPNGKYLFDVAFAEWQGKSMGVKVSVIVQDDSVNVIYEGQGELSAEIGEVLDKGTIMKHKSGQWIIGTKESDKELDEVGGCSGGPAIIDFINKKYWMC